MMNTRISDNVIYESPDSGKTIYARKMGETNRTLVSPERHIDSRIKKLNDIVLMAETDSEINYLLEQLEILYELKRDR